MWSYKANSWDNIPDIEKDASNSGGGQTQLISCALNFMCISIFCNLSYLESELQNVAINMNHTQVTLVRAWVKFEIKPNLILKFYQNFVFILVKAL